MATKTTSAARSKAGKLPADTTSAAASKAGRLSPYSREIKRVERGGDVGVSALALPKPTGEENAAVELPKAASANEARNEFSSFVNTQKFIKNAADRYTAQTHDTVREPNSYGAHMLGDSKIVDTGRIPAGNPRAGINRAQREIDEVKNQGNYLLDAYGRGLNKAAQGYVQSIGNLGQEIGKTLGMDEYAADVKATQDRWTSALQNTEWGKQNAAIASATAQRNAYEDQLKAATARDLARQAMSNGDFSSGSKYNPNLGNDNDFDINYETVNNSRRYQTQLLGEMINGGNKVNRNYAQLTPEETAVYNYYYNKGDKETAQAYLDGLYSDLEKRRYISDTSKMKEYATETPVGAFVVSPTLGSVSGIAAIPGIVDQMKTGRVNPYASYNSVGQMAQTTRSTAVENIRNSGVNIKGVNIGPALAFMYSTAQDIIENKLRMTMFGGLGANLGQAAGMSYEGIKALAKITTLTPMALNVYQSTVTNGKLRGLTDEEATMVAAVAAGAEIITESDSFDHIFDMFSSKDKGAGAFLKEVITEGGEELGSDAINSVADIMLLGEKSEWNESVQYYQEHDKLTEKQARRRAFIDKATDAALSTVGGMISGAYFGLGPGASNLLDASVTGAEMRQNRIRENAAAESEKAGQQAEAAEAEAKASMNISAEQWEASRKDQSGAAKKRRSVIRSTGIENGVDEETIRAVEAYSDTSKKNVSFYSEDAIHLDGYDKNMASVENTYQKKLAELNAQEGLSDEERARALQDLNERRANALKYVEDNYTAFKNGFHSKSKNSISINSKSPMPLHFILAHEGGHAIEGTNEYKALERLAADWYRRRGINFKQRIESSERLYQRAGITDVDAKSEAIADFFGQELFDNVEEINRAVSANHDLGQRIWNFINDKLTRLSGDDQLRMRAILTRAEELYGRALTGGQGSEAEKAAAPAQAAQQNVPLNVPQNVPQDVQQNVPQDKAPAQAAPAAQQNAPQNTAPAQTPAAPAQTPAEGLQPPAAGAAAPAQAASVTNAPAQGAAARTPDMGVPTADIEEEDYDESGDEVERMRSVMRGADLTDEEGNAKYSLTRKDVEETREYIDSLPEQKKFSVSTPVEKMKTDGGDELIAVHNIELENLVSTIQRWGRFPAPSIAIIRQGMEHDSFGDVSVVFKKEAVDPAAYEGNKIYRSDAFTGTIDDVPDFVFASNNADRIANVIGNVSPRYETGKFSSLDEAKNAKFLMTIEEKSALRDKLDVYKNVLDRKFANVRNYQYRAAGIIANSIADSISSENLHNATSEELNKYYNNDDYNIDRNPFFVTYENEGEYNNNIRSNLQKKVEDVISRVSSASDQQTREAIYTEFTNKATGLWKDILNDSKDIIMDAASFAESLYDDYARVRDNQTYQSNKYRLEHGTRYYEAKSDRAIGFDMVAGVIFPSYAMGSSGFDSVTEFLDENNIPIDFYSKNGDNSRAAAVNRIVDYSADAKFSITPREQEDVDSLDSGVGVTDDHGDTVADSDGSGHVKFSISTYDASGRALMDNWLKSHVKSGDLTEEDADDIRDSMEKMYSVCREYADKYGSFGAWSEAKVVADEKGNPVFSVVLPNSEYAMNIDFSTICKKRRALNAALNELIDRGVLDDMELDQQSIVKINQILDKHDFEIGCAICFVEAKRFRQASIVDSFVTLYNDMVRSMYPEGTKLGYHDYAGQDMRNGYSDLKPDFTHLNEIMKEYGSKTVEYKTASYLKNNPDARRLLNRSDFMTDRGIMAMRADKTGQRINSLYNSKKGTGGPKSSLGDMQYNHEIIGSRTRTFNRERAYAAGGVRIQSFSDYVAHMVFDYMEMVADLTAKKLPAHSYTKEADYARLFGLTGIKINMSLVPRFVEGGVAPGLDENGDYAWDKESFPYDVALEIENADGYGDNCGTIAVGVSDEHIRKLLADPNIRMVIPYHKSSLNPIIAEMMHIAAYSDYTDYQRTRGKDGKFLEKETFNFNKELHDDPNATPQSVAEKYIRWCEDNGYTPKFPQFAYIEHEGAETLTADGRKAVNPNYYKLLEDFTLFDKNGAYHPQGDVKMRFPGENDAFGSWQNLIEESLKKDNATYERLGQEIPGVADEIIDTLGVGEKSDGEGDVKHSITQNVTPEENEEYLRAARAGDTETAQRMVDEAAKRAGYDSPMLYHGTQSFGFTKFDPAKSDDGISLFATSDPKIAQTYSSRDAIRRVNTPQNLDTPEQIVAALKETSLMWDAQYFPADAIDKKADFADMILDRLIKQLNERAYFDAADDNAEEIRKAAGMFKRSVGTENVKQAAKDLYGAIKNAGLYRRDDIVYDTSLELSNAIDLLQCDWDAYWYLGNYHNREAAIRTLNKNGAYSGNYALYGRTDGMLEIDGGGESWNRVPISGDISKALSGERTATTREIARYGKDNRYMGVLIRNITDNGGIGKDTGAGDVYIYFDGISLKSADPITYDDKGNIIPLNERFNTKNDDIRYSITPAENAEYMKAAEAGDEETAGRMVADAANNWAGGEAIRVYHGSEYEGNIEVFITPNYSTTRKDVAETYAPEGKKENIYGLYFNPTGCLVVEGNGESNRSITVPDELKPWFDNVYGNKNHKASTDEIVEIAKKYNYNGVIFKNIKDIGRHNWEWITDEHGWNQAKTPKGGTDVIVAFSPNQIKSADPITYDSDGNIIPLNERFNPEEDRYKYSVTPNAPGGQAEQDNRLEPETFAEHLKSRFTGDQAPLADDLKARFPNHQPLDLEHLELTDKDRAAMSREAPVRSEREQALDRAAADAFVRHSNGDIAPPSANDTEGQKKMFDTQYAAAKKFNKAMDRHKLSKTDMALVRDLMAGVKTPEFDYGEAQNPGGVQEVFETLVEADRANRTVEAYKDAIHDDLTNMAREKLGNVDSFKDKRAGILYGRETQERNIRDIAPEADAEAIIAEYFDPVHVHTMQAKQLSDEYTRRVNALKIDTKKRHGNKDSENVAIQYIGEIESIIAELEEKTNAFNRRVESQSRKSHGKYGGADAAAQGGLSTDPYAKQPRKYGMTLDEYREALAKFKKDNPNLNYDEIHRKIAEMQKIYGELYDRLNEVYMRWGYPPMGKIKNYFPHFMAHEDGILNRIGGVLGFDQSAQGLPAYLAGLTKDFKPGRQWFANAMRRMTNYTEYDTLRGFERYIQKAADIIYHTEDIQKLRSYANTIRYLSTDAAMEEKIRSIRNNKTLSEDEKQVAIGALYSKKAMTKYNLANYVQNVDEYVNTELANKRSSADRWLEENFGRSMIYGAIKSYQRLRVRSAVQGNITSALTNIIPVAQVSGVAGIGTTSAAYLKTIGNMVRTMFGGHDTLREGSVFLQNRMDYESAIPKTMLNRLGDVASFPFAVMDRLGSETVWRALYDYNRRHGMSHETASALADKRAADIVADRSKGALPTLFMAHNPLINIFSRFMVEQNNTVSYLKKDVPRYFQGRKLRTGLAYAIIAMMSWLFNEGFEALFGRRPAQDALGIVNDLVGDISGYKMPNVFRKGGELISEGRLPTAEDFETEKKTVGGTIKNTAGNVIDQAPFSGAVGTLLDFAGIDLDLQGGRFEASDISPDIPRIIGVAKSEAPEENLRQVLAEELSKPVTGMLPAGNQIQKTAKGVATMIAGGSYKINDKGERLLQYPAEKNPGNWARAAIAGKSALPTAQDWVQNGFDTLNAKDTALYDSMTGAYNVKPKEAIGILKDLNGLEGEKGVESKEHKQRKMIVNSGIDPDAKLLLYQGKGLATKAEEAVISDLGPENINELLRTFDTLRDTKKTDEESGAHLKREVIVNSKLTGDTKLSMYNNIMLDSDNQNERDLLTDLGRLCDKDELVKAACRLKDGDTISDIRTLLDSKLPSEIKEQLYNGLVDKDDQEKIADFRSAGMSFEQFLSTALKYKEINKEDLTAGQKATEFSYWADQQGGTREQKQTIGDTFKYWQQIPAKASGYDKAVDTGLPADKAYSLSQQLAELTPKEGKSSVSDVQKAQVVASQADLSEEEKLKALRAVYSESENSTYSKAYVANMYGVPLEDYFKIVDKCLEVDADPKYKDYKAQERTAAVLNSFKSLTNKQRAAIWQVYNTGWVAKNNPYDSSVGAYVRSLYYEADGKTKKDTLPGGLSRSGSSSASASAELTPPKATVSSSTSSASTQAPAKSSSGSSGGGIASGLMAALAPPRG